MTRMMMMTMVMTTATTTLLMLTIMMKVLHWLMENMKRKYTRYLSTVPLLCKWHELDPMNL